ncbi:MAG: alpha-D-ribose 1-methylphosphonate 5-triphosphate diphosphatase [Gammaproteobacteria bacterium]|nr:alpha-D-ribose 1-methylphosphonate 5-triphosphate diphosphatase [Gammaproteobacteria bacterium]
MPEQIISNARIILNDEVIHGSIVIEDGKIRDIDHTNSMLSSAQDWDGDFLSPGLIELHTDNMEKYFTPRPGVIWPKLSAIMSHDMQMVSSGVTTVFDAVAVGYDIYKSNRAEILDDIIDSIGYISDNNLAKAEHFLHLRCELSCDATSKEFDAYADNPRLKLVSLMDHAPGQRQFARLDKYMEYYQKKYGYSDEDMARYIKRHKSSSETWSDAHRRYIAESCLERGIPMASHDDATLEHVDEALNYKVSIAEFPTTYEAANLSHKKDLKVLMGAPNLIRGYSHSGNVAARELAENGVLDILSSDYYPSSLLHSAFILSELDIGYDLAKAMRCVTDNPAQAVGLNDRGRIESGRIADILRVHEHDDLPVLIETWKSGQRVS